MTGEVQTPALARAKRADLVDVDHVINRLTGLAEHHQAGGRVSHAHGVRSAIEQIKRDLAGQRKAGRDTKPPN